MTGVIYASEVSVNSPDSMVLCYKNKSLQVIGILVNNEWGRITKEAVVMQFEVLYRILSVVVEVNHNNLLKMVFFRSIFELECSWK